MKHFHTIRNRISKQDQDLGQSFLGKRVGSRHLNTLRVLLSYASGNSSFHSTVVLSRHLDIGFSSQPRTNWESPVRSLPKPERCFSKEVLRKCQAGAIHIYIYPYSVVMGLPSWSVPMSCWGQEKESRQLIWFDSHMLVRNKARSNHLVPQSHQPFEVTICSRTHDTTDRSSSFWKNLTSGFGYFGESKSRRKSIDSFVHLNPKISNRIQKERML